MKLAGIIYLHEISQTKISSDTQRNIQTFKELCGDEAMQNVVLGTTKWGDMNQEVGCRKEQQLSDTLWKDMIERGSTTVRFEGTHESARSIIDLVLDKDPVDFVLIQTELVMLHRFIAQTAAGRTLRWTMQELREQQEALARDMCAVVVKGGNSRRLKQKWVENRRRIRSTLAIQLRQFKIPMDAKMKSMFGLQ